MNKIEIDAGLCKACALCASVCPKHLIVMGKTANSHGYYYAEQTSSENCTACRLCAIMCPDSAITVYRGERSENNG